MNSRLIRTVVTLGGWVLLAGAWMIAYHQTRAAQMAHRQTTERTNPFKSNLNGPDFPEWHNANPNDKEFIANLKKDYTAFNEYFFGNRLPKTLEVALVPSNNDLMGLTLHDARTGVYTVYVSHRWNPSPNGARMTLLHEMCHVKTFDTSLEHGREWQSCMKQLAMSDAFETIW